MSLIKKYTDNLSVIEIYDDSINVKEEILTEIYDLCNEIAIVQQFNEDQIEEYFYSKEELKNYQK